MIAAATTAGFLPSCSFLLKTICEFSVKISVRSDPFHRPRSPCLEWFRRTQPCWDETCTMVQDSCWLNPACGLRGRVCWSDPSFRDVDCCARRCSSWSEVERWAHASEAEGATRIATLNESGAAALATAWPIAQGSRPARHPSKNIANSTPTHASPTARTH